MVQWEGGEGREGGTGTGKGKSEKSEEVKKGKSEKGSGLEELNHRPSHFYYTLQCDALPLS